MNNRVLFFAAVLAVLAGSFTSARCAGTNNPSLWSKVTNFTNDSWSQVKDYRKSESGQKFEKKWNNPAGYTGILGGLVAFQGVRWLSSMRYSRFIGPLFIGLWSCHKAHNMVKLRFPVSDLDQKWVDAIAERKKEQK